MCWRKKYFRRNNQTEQQKIIKDFRPKSFFFCQNTKYYVGLQRQVTYYLRMITRERVNWVIFTQIILFGTSFVSHLCPNENISYFKGCLAWHWWIYWKAYGGWPCNCLVRDCDLSFNCNWLKVSLRIQHGSTLYYIFFLWWLASSELYRG